MAAVLSYKRERRSLLLVLSFPESSHMKIVILNGRWSSSHHSLIRTSCLTIPLYIIIFLRRLQSQEPTSRMGFVSYSAQRQTSGKVIVGRENGDLVGDGCEQNSIATDPTTNSGISDSKVLSSIGRGPPL